MVNLITETMPEKFGILTEYAQRLPHVAGEGENQWLSSNRVIQVGSCANQIESTRQNPQRERVYHIEGISPTLNTAQGGGLNPYIVVYERK